MVTRSGGKILQPGNHQSPDGGHAIISSPRASRPKLGFPGRYVQFCHSVSLYAPVWSSNVFGQRLEQECGKIHNNVKMSQITDYFRKKG